MLSYKACTYDNPYMMRRECWLNGKLFASYSETLIGQDGAIVLPGRYVQIGANTGPWNPGRCFGDPEAMLQQETPC